MPAPLETLPSPSQSVDQRAQIALVLLPLAVLAALALLPVRVEVPADLRQLLHVLFEMAIVAMALATFAVQWFAAGARVVMDGRARFLAAAFLGTGLLELLHLLSTPGMPGFLGPPGADRATYYWFAARCWTVLSLLAVLWMPSDGGGQALRRRWLVPSTLAMVLVLVAAEVMVPRPLAWFDRPGTGLTPLRSVLEWALAASAFGAALVSGRRDRALHGAGPRGKVTTALLAMGLGETWLAFDLGRADLAGIAGHLYLAIAFWLLFDSLFVSTLLRPYRELEALRAHVEDELVVTIRRLERMREQREDFLRAVSHDLRNPLQVVLLQAERIGRASADAPALQRPVSAIRFAGRRMERMLRDLTDAAQLEVGELRLVRERVDLKGFVDHLLEVEQGVLDSARVRNQVDPALPPLDVDPDRLDRILVNLLGNALKYSDGEVRIGAERADGGLRITVADRGAGIPEADLSRIFERYYRGHRHEGEGLGLGLFIVKGLVEAHGGAIGVASTPGEGSTFTLRLPAAEAGEARSQRTRAR
ncbi:MAG TPA: MASE3 domain-containing protein [Myxococcota bacterium]|nr:MASE3 domain-containing protein [Myxococcota bacterium]